MRPEIQLQDILYLNRSGISQLKIYSSAPSTVPVLCLVHFAKIAPSELRPDFLLSLGAASSHHSRHRIVAQAEQGFSHALQYIDKRTAGAGFGLPGCTVEVGKATRGRYTT